MSYMEVGFSNAYIHEIWESIINYCMNWINWNDEILRTYDIVLWSSLYLDLLHGNVRIPLSGARNSFVYTNHFLNSLPITQIACGSHHAVILTDRNELYVTPGRDLQKDNQHCDDIIKEFRKLNSLSLIQQ